MLEAQQRVQNLPLEATGKDVRKALWLLPNGSDNARSAVQRALKKERSGRKGRSAAVDGQVRELDHLRRGLYEAEEELLSKLHDAQEERISDVADTVSTLTISFVTSHLIQSHRPEGATVYELCTRLTDALRWQFTRDMLLRRYSQQSRHAKAEAVRHRADAEHLTTLLATQQRTAGGTASVDGTARNADAESVGGIDEAVEAAEERAKTEARKAYYLDRHAEQVEKYNGRQTQGTARYLDAKGVENWDGTPSWDAGTRMQLGAYLLRMLATKALFQPQGDDIARRRERYWGEKYGSHVSALLGDAEELTWSADASEGEDGGELGFSPFRPSAAATAESEDDPSQLGACLWSAPQYESGDADDGIEDGVLVGGHDYLSDLPETLDLSSLFAPASEEGMERRGGGGTVTGEEAAAAHAQGMMHAFQILTLPMGGRQSINPTPSNALETKKMKVYMRAHPLLYDALVAGDVASLRTRVAPEARPMLAPPLAWYKRQPGTLPMGGEYHIDTTLVRTHSQRHLAKLAEMPSEEYQHVLDGLNALSATPWRINERVLRVVEYLWEAYPKGLPHVPDSPATVDVPQPPVLEGLSEEETRRQERLYIEEVRYAMRRRANLHSQRIAARLKLEVAKDFVHETFYFPHNLDFRGRTYAVGPHLQYLGDDLARGLLAFEQTRPLGPNGLRWLKVQLANLCGKDKLSLDGRVEWSNEQLASGIIATVSANPVSKASLEWWTASENPVQTLALCFELDAASKADRPELFESRVAVHADGSCNGLQHYAALGRDQKGAAQVNLVPGDMPSDIYAGVRTVVEEKVHAHATATLPPFEVFAAARFRGEQEEDALAVSGQLSAVLDGEELSLDLTDTLAKEDGKRKGKRKQVLTAADVEKEYAQKKEQQRLARFLDGKITRKVVKQTVMTTVYGVTRLGATQQIYNRLAEVHEENGFDEEVQRKDLKRMAAYVAGLTLESLDENFKGATESMRWLLDVARHISKESKMPVEWTTPLGWPVVQPYFQIRSRRVNTVLHDMTVIEESDLPDFNDNTTAAVKTYKQTQALPPNYVHSLDSSHMLRTARACHQKGITFAAVHDSYWTHACNMEPMNEILRDEFITLHKETGLARLYEQMKAHYTCKEGRGSECPGYDLKGEKKGNCKHAEGCLRVRWENFEKEPPKLGDLDINVVRASKYFFS